ncbi:hypothetical protein Tco_1557638 [Tanacetum coccineum]
MSLGWRGMKPKWDLHPNMPLIEYQVEYEIPFRLIHCWKELRECHKWKRVELPNFEADKADKNKRYKDDEETDVQEVQRPMGRDLAKKKASASSTSSSSNNEDELARKRELELKAQEIKMRDMEQRRQDIQF